MVEAASSYPLLNAFWTMLVFFAWVIWFWLLIVIFSDLFRREDISGWGKAGWFILVLIVPFIGVLIYLIAQGGHMAERRNRDATQAQSQFDSYVKSVSSESSAEQISKAKQLLDSGAITQAEFEHLKSKALAA